MNIRNKFSDSQKGLFATFTETMRIKSWLKNVLIFIPLVFGGLFSRDNILHTLFAFTSFSLVSSGVYIINDLIDCKR